MNVCVFGASSDELEPRFFDAAEAMGRALAENGLGMVFGGGAHGLMGAAARGAHSAGGYIVGIAPRFFDRPGVLFEHCSELVFTETMRERKRRMEELSDAFVVLPGGIGTFEEFFEVLTLKQLGRHRKPIAVLNTDGYYVPLFQLLEHAVDRGFMLEKCRELYECCRDPEACIRVVRAGASPEIDLWKLKKFQG